MMGSPPLSRGQYSRAEPSPVYRDAAADARHLSVDALLSWRDALIADLADDDPDCPGPVGHYLATERLRAVDAELARRERLSRIGRGVASPADRTYEAWHDLARAVSERADVPDLMTACGHVLTARGHNGRRGGPEYSAACPVCGGADRLRVWGGRNGRAWCRQCAWSADAVALAQSFVPGCETFRDAVKWVAVAVGEAVPVTPVTPGLVIRKGGRATTR